MMKKLLTIGAVLTLTACTASVTDPNGMDGMNHSSMDMSEHNHGDDSSQGQSLDRLNNSPRHQEWVEVKNGDKTIRTWVVYPQVTGKAPVVVLIHENKGLNDWARGMADQVAEAGYIAVAPDLLSDFSEEYNSTSDFPSDDERTKAISSLKPENVQSDLKAVVAWAETIPASNGKLASAGFCWGGARSFEFAAAGNDVDAALVFYGTGLTNASDYAKINTPVYGFYGGADERVNATIPTSTEEMNKAGKSYEPVTYDGAGHAFMRLGEDPAGTPENMSARNAAWERMKSILSAL